MTWDPVTDKRILTLHPLIRIAVEDAINQVQQDTGVTLRVSEALRTPAQQAVRFAQGRTTPGIIVTHTLKSYHILGLAFDVVEINPDKSANWKPDYSVFVDIIKAHGFQWGGDFPPDQIDRPHFQRTYGKSFDELKNLVDASGYPTL